jgi:hypothetical protein
LRDFIAQAKLAFLHEQIIKDLSWMSANRKLSGFYGGISPVKSASRQEIKH